MQALKLCRGAAADVVGAGDVEAERG
jgi:hypothetical protein